jgi:single-stranded-DNA-specific exonuclease
MTLRNGKKFLWEIKTAPEERVAQLAARFSLTQSVAHALYARGWHDENEINLLLNGTADQVVAPARLLHSADKALDRILLAIENGEKILIFGDYDVDGATSTAILLLALLPLKAKVNFFLPIRAQHGYGLSIYAVEQAAKNGYSLIITVDNGISAFEPAKRAKELGIDLIITDHHKPHETVPVAFCIVNPQQKECQFPHKSLAGVGVAFKLMSLLYERLGKQLPEKTYELLMLGTVADVVPLRGENRYWVQKGLALINQNKSLAISQLLANAQLDKERISSRDVGFMLTPQINALGRLDDPRDAVKFLISANQEAVSSIGAHLKSINEERKRIERTITMELEDSIHKKEISLETEYALIAGSNSWPAGVIGLVAGKLTHNYGRPTFLFHLTSQGLAKGSCRSPEGIDLFKLLEGAKEMLTSFGGHQAAAGLALPAKRLPEFKTYINKAISELVTLEELRPRIKVDAPLDLSDVTHQLTHDLDRLEPFGAGNEEPVFSIPNLSLVRAPRLMKDKHVKVMAFSNGMLKPIIFFNRPELYDYFLNLGDNEFEVAATISRNEWNGKVSTELLGLDVANTKPA